MPRSPHACTLTARRDEHSGTVHVSIACSRTAPAELREALARAAAELTRPPAAPAPDGTDDEAGTTSSPPDATAISDGTEKH